MSVRRVSVDVLPSRYPRLSTSDECHGQDYDIYYSHGHFSRQSSFHYARPNHAFIQSLIIDSRTPKDLEGVFPMLDSIFAYVAANTAFFSPKTSRSNLRELMESLSNLHVQQVRIWKRDMFLALQGSKANISSIRKLIRINGFDLDSEIGPIPIKDRWFEKAPSPKYHTALTWASWQGNLNLVKCLLAEGACPNALTTQGLAAIHCCSMRNDENNLAVLKHFLEHPRLKIDVNFCNDSDGATSLMYACSFGSYKIAEYLLQQNAEVNRQDSEGKSAIFYAVRGGHLDLVQLLISYNVCVYLRDNNNATVLHHLLFVYPRTNITISKLSDILTYLVDEKGLSVTNQACNGNTVLHEACRNGLTDVVSYLLGKGAKLEAKKNGWETPLWTLVMGKHPRPQLVMLLLEKGANFEVRHCLGLTLIEYAKLLSKNPSLVAVLEDAHRILRAKRMKALLAKRRELFTTTVPCKECATRDPPCVFTPIQREMTRSIDNGNVNNNNEGRSLEEDDKKPLFEKIHENFGNTDLEACSSISSDSFPSESGGEEEEDHYDSYKDDCYFEEGERENPEGSAEEEEDELLESDDVIFDNEMLTNNGSTANEMVINDARSTFDDEMTSEYDTSTLSGTSSSSSEEDDDDEDRKANIQFLHSVEDEDDDDEGKKNDNQILISKNVEDTDNKVGDNCAVRNDSDIVKDIYTESASTSNPKKSFDVDECFERLLRKKRLLEEESLKSLDTEDKDERAIPVPQKIMCVRRSAVSLSDSD